MESIGGSLRPSGSFTRKRAFARSRNWGSSGGRPPGGNRGFWRFPAFFGGKGASGSFTTSFGGNGSSRGFPTSFGGNNSSGSSPAFFGGSRSISRGGSGAFSATATCAGRGARGRRRSAAVGRNQESPAASRIRARKPPATSATTGVVEGGRPGSPPPRAGNGRGPGAAGAQDEPAGRGAGSGRGRAEGRSVRASRGGPAGRAGAAAGAVWTAPHLPQRTARPANSSPVCTRPSHPEQRKRMAMTPGSRKKSDARPTPGVTILHGPATVERGQAV